MKQALNREAARRYGQGKQLGIVMAILDDLSVITDHPPSPHTQWKRKKNQTTPEEVEH
jgi:hypothetical protein